MTRAASWLCAAAVALGCAGPVRAAPLPYELRVDVGWADPPGPTAFAERLELEIAARLDQERCFAAVHRARPEADPDDRALRLRVTLADFLEETVYPATLAERANPRGAGLEASGQSSARARVGVEILGPRGEPLRARGFHREVVLRALTPEQDVRPATREALVSAIAREIRRVACKGSARDWERRLERARGKPAGPRSR